MQEFNSLANTLEIHTSVTFGLSESSVTDTLLETSLLFHPQL